MPGSRLRGNSIGRRIHFAPALRSNRQNAYTDFMTGLRSIRPRPQTGSPVLQFAPNFTAYVMPPDVVCLYSEDRKFFLHGALYCALATAIGKNGRAAPEIVR